MPPLIVQGSSKVVTGPFQKEGHRIKDNSVDLIFTDPPYSRTALEHRVYADLSRFASRVLKPGGLCLAYAGQFYLPGVLYQLGEYLDFHWTICLTHNGPSMTVRSRGIQQMWKPILAFVKPPLDPWWDVMPDLIDGAGREKDHHEWQQGLEEAEQLIDTFCPPRGTVCDPCCGSGTTIVAAERLGMRGIGVEIDLATADVARTRIREAAAVAFAP